MALWTVRHEKPVIMFRYHADPDYQAFVAKLADGTTKLPSAEAQMAAKEEAAREAGAEGGAKPLRVVTPLMQYIIDRHEQRLDRRGRGRIPPAKPPDSRAGTTEVSSPPNADMSPLLSGTPCTPTLTFSCFPGASSLNGSRPEPAQTMHLALT